MVSAILAAVFGSNPTRFALVRFDAVGPVHRLGLDCSGSQRGFQGREEISDFSRHSRVNGWSGSGLIWLDLLPLSRRFYGIMNIWAVFCGKGLMPFNSRLLRTSFRMWHLFRHWSSHGSFQLFPWRKSHCPWRVDQITCNCWGSWHGPTGPLQLPTVVEWAERGVKFSKHVLEHLKIPQSFDGNDPQVGWASNVAIWVVFLFNSQHSQTAGHIFTVLNLGPGANIAWSILTPSKALTYLAERRRTSESTAFAQQPPFQQSAVRWLMLSSDSSDLSKNKNGVVRTERAMVDQCRSFSDSIRHILEVYRWYSIPLFSDTATSLPFFLTTLLCRSVLWALDRESFNNIAPCRVVLPVGTPSIVSFQTHVSIPLGFSQNRVPPHGMVHRWIIIFPQIWSHKSIEIHWSCNHDVPIFFYTKMDHFGDQFLSFRQTQVKKAAVAHREQLEEFLQRVPLLQTMEAFLEGLKACEIDL